MSNEADLDDESSSSNLIIAVTDAIIFLVPEDALILLEELEKVQAICAESEGGGR